MDATHCFSTGWRFLMAIGGAFFLQNDILDDDVAGQKNGLVERVGHDLKFRKKTGGGFFHIASSSMTVRPSVAKDPRKPFDGERRRGADVLPGGFGAFFFSLFLGGADGWPAFLRPFFLTMFNSV